MRYLIGITLIASTAIGALTMQTNATAQITRDAGAKPKVTRHDRNWDRHAECRFQGLDGRMGYIRSEVERTIRCVSRKFGVSTSEALMIADRESHDLEWVTNSSSGACGIFQHIQRYFLGRLRAVPNRYKPLADDCWNARSNTFAALYMVKTSGWGAWTTA